MIRYPIKWKGRETGPFTEEEILAKLGTREISPMHEIFTDGEWQTIRVFQRNRHSPPASPQGAQIGSQSLDGKVPPPLPPNRSNRGTVPKKPEPVSVADEGEIPATSSLPSPSPGSTMERGKAPPIRILIYAGFWTRAVATVFDLLLMAIPPAIVLLVSGINPLVPPTPETPKHLLVIALVTASITSWIYFAAMESSSLQATIGKWIVGLVVASEGGERITFQNATSRHFSKALSAAMIFAGFFLAAFTRNKQAFHDLIARSTVNHHFDTSRIFSPPRESPPTTNTYSQEYGKSLF